MFGGGRAFLPPSFAPQIPPWNKLAQRTRSSDRPHQLGVGHPHAGVGEGQVARRPPLAPARRGRLAQLARRRGSERREKRRRRSTRLAAATIIVAPPAVDAQRCERGGDASQLPQ